MFFLLSIPTLLILSTFLLFMKTPLTMGFCIFLMAFTSTAITATLMPSWFAYLLFLIYVSGMLVMFAYFVAISPNQKFSFRPVMTSAAMSTTALVLLMSMSYWAASPIMFSTSTMQTQPTAIYTFSAIPTLALVAIILLLALFAAVKLATRRNGAMRPFKSD